MRRFFLSATLLASFAFGGALIPNQANAMTISAPAAVAQAVGENNATEVAYVCRRIWTRWGWRRSCGWRPGPYYGYGYYGRPYGYYGWRRPYARRYWW